MQVPTHLLALKVMDPVSPPPPNVNQKILAGQKVCDSPHRTYEQRTFHGNLLA